MGAHKRRPYRIYPAERAAGRWPQLPQEIGNADVEQIVHHRNHNQRQGGGADQPTDDYRGEFRADDAALAAAEGRQWQQGEAGGQRRHQDGAQPYPASRHQSLGYGHSSTPQLLDEGYQHYGIGNDYTDEQQQAHHGREAEGAPGNRQCDHHPNERQGQAGDDDKRVSQRPEAGHHHQIHQDDAHCHRQEDGLETLGNVGEDAAAGYADSRRKVKLGNLPVYLDAYCLGVLGGNVSRNAGRALPVGAADGHRAFPGGDASQLAAAGPCRLGLRYQVAHLVNAACRFSTAGKDNFGRFPINGYGGYRSPHKELAKLEPDLARGQPNFRGGGRVHFYSHLLPGLSNVARQVDHAVHELRRTPVRRIPGQYPGSSGRQC